jgi:hypothetical protein
LVDPAVPHGSACLARPAASLRRERDPGIQAAGIVALGGSLRSLLGSYHLAYFCVLRCKATVLTPISFQQVNDVVDAGKAEHPGYRFLDVGPAWLVGVPLALVVIAAVLGWVFARGGTWRGGPMRPAAVFGVLAAASTTIDCAGPSSTVAVRVASTLAT